MNQFGPGTVLKHCLYLKFCEFSNGCGQEVESLH